MRKEMSFGHALYYPHINLNNKNWIKHALLFWDKISRIVPRSVEPDDSEDIIRIKNESDFIEDYHPDKWDTSNVFNNYCYLIRDYIESNSFHNHRFFERERRFRDMHPESLERRKFLSGLVRSNGTYIHIEKTDPLIRDYLFSLGLAIPGENEYSDWIKIDNEIGLLYMTYFAKTISNKNSLPIVTDIEQSFCASIQYEPKIFSDYNVEFEYRLGNLMIETVVPKNINNVSIEKILNIRNKYDLERTAYFVEISNLAKSISTIDNDGALKDALNQKSRLIKRNVDNLRQLYDRNGIETINKFLSISVPSVLISTSQYISETLKPILIAGGVLFGIISAANEVKKSKHELQENPLSYLLNLKSELSGSDLLTRINDTVKGIRKW